MREPVVIFDFGNVVCFFDYHRAFERFGRLLGSSAAAVKDHLSERGFAEIMARFETGMLTGREFAANVSALTGLNISFEEFAGLVYTHTTDMPKLRALTENRATNVAMGNFVKTRLTTGELQSIFTWATDEIGPRVPLAGTLSKGEADFGVAVLASAVPLISSGAVRPLALAAPSATPLVAKVPLLEQLGMKDTTLTSWVIMIGPKGLPADIVKRLNGAINEAIAEPDVKERLLKAGIETYAPATPAETGAYLKQDVERYRTFQSELGDRLTK